jgi:hypothetical protein
MPEAAAQHADDEDGQHEGVELGDGPTLLLLTTNLLRSALAAVNCPWFLKPPLNFLAIGGKSAD